MVDISVIIVNYNVRDLLGNCINSVITASRNLNYEIIIVDNNSFDGSVELLRSKFSNNPKIKIVESRVNLGFAKANNLGAKYAGGKYLLILNPDTVLREDTLDKCISYYGSDESIGALTCKLILPNGKLDLACRRSFPAPSVAVFRMVGLSKLFPKSKLFGKYNLTYLNEDETCEVDSVCGAFMLMRTELYKELGGFDEDYFMYGEDLDLCFRIKRAGFKVYYYPETSIIHFKGESTRKSSLSYVSNFYGAMKIFVGKNLKESLGFFSLLIRVSIVYSAFVSYLVRFLRNSYPAFLDLILIIIAMLVSIRLRFEFFPIEEYQLVIIIYSIVWMLTLSMSGTYNRNHLLSLIKPLNGILAGFFVNSAFTYFFNEFAFSRAVILRTTAYSYMLLAGWRGIIKIINFTKHKDIFLNSGRTVIVGKNDESEKFINKLKKRVDIEYNIIGYISADASSSNGFIGNLDNLRDIIKAYRVSTVVFAKNALSNQQMLDLMWELQNYNLDFKILSGEADIILGKSTLDKIDEMYMMQIEYNINKKFNIFVKRLFDLFLGLISIFTAYPAVLLLVKLFKFSPERTKFLKKILLIPQVITGKYCFVGRATWDTTSMGKEYLGKNGLTGLVQINFYKNLTTEEVENYNFYYAKNQSLTLDIEILVKTASLFFFRKSIPQL